MCGIDHSPGSLGSVVGGWEAAGVGGVEGVLQQALGLGRVGWFDMVAAIWAGWPRMLAWRHN